MTDGRAIWATRLRATVQKLLPFAVLAACAIVLWPQLAALDAQELATHWRAISPSQWIAAIALTALSFLAVGQYDVLAHRQLGTGLAPSAARRCGMITIAISQTTGFGILVATLARWRLLSGFGPAVAAQVTGFVSALFLAALAGVGALACLLLPTPAGFVWPCIAILAVLSGLICFALWMPRISWRGHMFDLPSLRAMAAASASASVDILAAGLAIYVLFPSGTAPPLAAFMPVFIVALSAGLFSGTPGGVGPFEMTLLALTAPLTPAAADTTAVVVAIFGFRLVYFAAPAALAIAALVLPRAAAPLWQDPPAPSVHRARRAETAVIAQTGGKIERIGPLHCATWQIGQAVVGLFDPFEPVRTSQFFDRFKQRAIDANRVACLYKCSARTAMMARRTGWSALHIADDAVLDLADYVLDTPSRARLRRKLRKADKSGITVRRAQARDMPALARIDADWQQAHGGARGGTMGRFCPTYLTPQAVFVAEHNGALVAFVSFHVIAREWALDVMRHAADVPDGTMHALVHAGLMTAQSRGVPRLSLSATVACPDPTRALWRWVAQKRVEWSGGTGLRQFKSAFAPAWRPLYAVAPTRLALAISLADITREVMRPSALPQAGAGILPADLSDNHKEDEYYEVASSSAA